MKENNKVLLHACCGICSGHPIEYLRELGYEPVVYFFNPNIQPYDEYERRLEAQKTVCHNLDCELIVGDYDDNVFEQAVVGLENQPEGGLRCNNCFELRLRETALKACELGINYFTTSIVISPHKNYKKISKIGESIAKENCLECRVRLLSHQQKVYQLEYLDINFKKKDGFLKTNNMSKEFNLYRQNYCGCLYGKMKNEKLKMKNA